MAPESKEAPPVAASAVMAPAAVPEEEANPPEPEKVVPVKGSDGADTPSGAALMKVGAPDPEDAGSPAEAKRAAAYREEKHRKRWLS